MIKKLIPLAWLFPGMLFATPTPSPTPVRAEIGGFRVPIGSSVIYGYYDGNPVRVQVDATGRLVVDAGETVWGGIAGTLSNQTDLVTVLGDKYDADNPDGFITGLAWGEVTGTLSNQTDLDSALSGKYGADNPDGFISGVAWGDITGTLSSQTDLDTALLVEMTDIRTPYAKFHNQTTVTFANNTDWHDIEFDFTPAIENSYGITLGSDNKTVTFDFNGHVQINGCIRPEWTGGQATQAYTATRIVFSDDEWSSYDEARCLQAYVNRQRQQNEMTLLAFNGSLTVSTGMQIRLQGRVSNTSMILSPNELFLNPVSASINIYAVGKEPE